VGTDEEAERNRQAAKQQIAFTPTRDGQAVLAARSITSCPAHAKSLADWTGWRPDQRRPHHFRGDGHVETVGACLREATPASAMTQRDPAFQPSSTTPPPGPHREMNR
jgi:hypothetical protein